VGRKRRLVGRTLTIAGGKDDVSLLMGSGFLLLTLSLQPKHSAAAEQYFDGSWRGTDFDLGHGHPRAVSREVVAFGACGARSVPRTLAEGLISEFR